MAEKLEWFLENPRRITQRAMMLQGPSGTGKATLIRHIAKKRKLRIRWFDTGCLRTDVDFDTFLCTWMNMRFRNRVVVIRAVETLSWSILQKLIRAMQDVNGVKRPGRKRKRASTAEPTKKATLPLLLTSSVTYFSHFSSLQPHVMVVEMNRLPGATLLTFLKHICGKERIQISEDHLRDCVTDARGDVRFALMQLEFERYAEELAQILQKRRTEQAQTAKKVREEMKVDLKSEPAASSGFVEAMKHIQLLHQEGRDAQGPQGPTQLPRARVDRPLSRNFFHFMKMFFRSTIPQGRWPMQAQFAVPQAVMGVHHNLYEQLEDNVSPQTLEELVKFQSDYELLMKKDMETLKGDYLFGMHTLLDQKARKRGKLSRPPRAETVLNPGKRKHLQELARLNVREGGLCFPVFDWVEILDRLGKRYSFECILPQYAAECVAGFRNKKRAARKGAKVTDYQSSKFLTAKMDSLRSHVECRWSTEEKNREKEWLD